MQAYSASQSFPDALSALEDLESYGFIYRPRDETGQPGDQFYPTHLATSLCSGDVGSLGSQTADEKRFLILETNYKIYAYTGESIVSHAALVSGLTCSQRAGDCYSKPLRRYQDQIQEPSCWQA